jgi:hypothetical protein
MNDSIGTLRLDSFERIFKRAFRMYRGANVSPAGDAVTMFPPNVPMFLMGGDPKFCTALARRGRSF